MKMLQEETFPRQVIPRALLLGRELKTFILRRYPDAERTLEIQKAVKGDTKYKTFTYSTHKICVILLKQCTITIQSVLFK